MTALLLSACGAGEADPPATDERGLPVVTVYRPPTWGCCGGWSEYMRDNGYTVKVEDDQNRAALRDRYDVPLQIQSCHTAIVDGYIIEGHVPVDEIERLLAERPDIVGLAVIGMPSGSPGMEVEGQPQQPFEVLAFDKEGNTEVYASYPKWMRSLGEILSVADITLDGPHQS